MNRIAILILILIVVALAILLIHRNGTGAAAGLDPSEASRRPEAALQQAETLIQQARDGAAAAEQARKTLTPLIENAPASLTALKARQSLAHLEQVLGNNEAAGDLLLDAVRAHPEAEETPRMLFDLGLLLAGPLKRPDEASTIFKRVVSLYPDHPLAPEAMIRLTRIIILLKYLDHASQLSDLRAFFEDRPDHPLADEARLLSSGLTTHQESEHE